MRSTALQLDTPCNPVDPSSIDDALQSLPQPVADVRIVETRRLEEADDSASSDDQRQDEDYFHTLYNALHNNKRPARDRHRAYDFIQEQIAVAQAMPCELPEFPDDLGPCINRRLSLILQGQCEYYHRRQQGGAREYFPSKAHALLFMQRIAPRKLVDCSWLYGTLSHWDDARLRPLIHRYLEFLGQGNAADNRVHIYQKMLEQEGINAQHAQPDDDYHQACIQLALGLSGSRLLPEVIGFHLGYECLMLQVLNCRDELFELVDVQGFGPYNNKSGSDLTQIRIALQVISAMLPPDEEHRLTFYRRIKDGYRLSHIGGSALDIVNNLQQPGSLEQAVMESMVNHFGDGRLGHDVFSAETSTDCPEDLSGYGEVKRFITVMKAKGWIRLGSDPCESRFWQMIHLDNGMMSGVFSAAEKQVIYDWIARTGQPEADDLDAVIPPKYRKLPSQHISRKPSSKQMQREVPAELSQQWERGDPIKRFELLIPYLRTAVHPTPVGVWAARHYQQLLTSHTPLANLD